MHAVALFRRWIQHYSVWRQTGEWPSGGTGDVKDRLFARVERLFDVRAFEDLWVLVAGCGSGGGQVAQYLAMSGVRKFILVDRERARGRERHSTCLWAPVPRTGGRPRRSPT